MPGVKRFGTNKIVAHLKPIVENGLKSVLIFGVPKTEVKVFNSAQQRSQICAQNYFQNPKIFRTNAVLLQKIPQGLPSFRQFSSLERPSRTSLLLATSASALGRATVIAASFRARTVKSIMQLPSRGWVRLLWRSQRLDAKLSLPLI